MEKHKEYSPEEIAKIDEARAASDTEAVRKGADIKPGSVIEFTYGQKERAKIQYEEAIKRAEESIKDLKSRIHYTSLSIKDVEKAYYAAEKIYGWKAESEERARKRIQDLDERITKLEDDIKAGVKMLGEIKAGIF